MGVGNLALPSDVLLKIVRRFPDVVQGTCQEHFYPQAFRKTQPLSDFVAQASDFCQMGDERGVGFG
jgi:hypothetical protein